LASVEDHSDHGSLDRCFKLMFLQFLFEKCIQFQFLPNVFHKVKYAKLFRLADIQSFGMIDGFSFQIRHQFFSYIFDFLLVKPVDSPEITNDFRGGDLFLLIPRRLGELQIPDRSPVFSSG
jgi:hypothetical protein